MLRQMDSSRQMLMVLVLAGHCILGPACMRMTSGRKMRRKNERLGWAIRRRSGLVTFLTETTLDVQPATIEGLRALAHTRQTG